MLQTYNYFLLPKILRIYPFTKNPIIKMVPLLLVFLKVKLELTTLNVWITASIELILMQFTSLPFQIQLKTTVTPITTRATSSNSNTSLNKYHPWSGEKKLREMVFLSRISSVFPSRLFPLKTALTWTF